MKYSEYLKMLENLSEDEHIETEDTEASNKKTYSHLEILNLVGSQLKFDYSKLNYNVTPTSLVIFDTPEATLNLIKNDIPEYENDYGVQFDMSLDSDTDNWKIKIK